MGGDRFGSGWNKITQVQQSWLAPAAASTTAGADQFDFGTAVPANLANLVQPDYPRNLVYNLTGTFTSVAITATGVDAQGRAATESVTITSDTNGSVAFATVTQIRITAQTGGAGGELLDIGYGVKMGLMNAISSSADIYKTLLDGADDPVSGHTIDAVNGTVTFATAPNNTHNYEAFYRGI